MVQVKQKRGTGVKPRLQEASGAASISLSPASIDMIVCCAVDSRMDRRSRFHSIQTSCASFYMIWSIVYPYDPYHCVYPYIHMDRRNDMDHMDRSI